MMRLMRFAAVVALATIFAGLPVQAQEQAAPDMQTATCGQFTSASDDSPYVAFVQDFAASRGSAATAASHVDAVRQACQSLPEVGFASMVEATAPAPMAAAGLGPSSCSAPPTTTCGGCSVSCEAGRLQGRPRLRCGPLRHPRALHLRIMP
jgi:hypothetical protein